MTLYTAIQVLGVMFQSRPIAGAWNPIIQAKAMCIPINLRYVILGTIYVLTDVVLLVEPLPAVRELRRRKRMKAGYEYLVYWRLISSSPSSAGYVGITLTSYAWHGHFANPYITASAWSPSSTSLNFTVSPWSLPPVPTLQPTNWTGIEFIVAIAFCCAIPFRPLFSWIFRLGNLGATSGLQQ